MTTETKSAFARRLGVAPSYVTKLLQAGRLVAIGNCIDVETSLALIEATKDPNRDDVRQRHAQVRDEKRLTTRRAGEVAAPPASPAPDAVTNHEPAHAPQEATKPLPKSATAFREARADRTHYQARTAEMRVAQLRGKLVDVAKVRQCGVNDGAMLRTLLENLPDLGAPRLAGVRDPATAARILNGLLVDIEQTMSELLTKNEMVLRQRPEGGSNADRD